MKNSDLPPDAVRAAMLVEPARGPQPSARRERPGHSEVRRRARVFRGLRVCFGYTRGFPRHQLPAILRLDVHRKVANTKAGVLTVDSRYGPIFSLRLFLLREGMTGAWESRRICLVNRGALQGSSEISSGSVAESL